MIQESIIKLEQKIKQAPDKNSHRYKELLALLNELKIEISALSDQDADQAESIAGFTRSTIHEATREMPKPQQFERSLDSLQTSIEEFEASHPKLVKNINSLCVTLANLGL